MVEDLNRVKEFWQGYRAAVLRQGVPPARAEWFIRWASGWHARCQLYRFALAQKHT
jgi:hypothetical protein